MALGDYASKFTTRLDKIIERETLTNDLNMNGDLLGEFSGVGEIKIATIAMDGLANYSRENGFVKGSVSTDWETYKLRYDRGREFNIDAMDDEERAAIVSANVMAEVERTKVCLLYTSTGERARGQRAHRDDRAVPPHGVRSIPAH